MLGATVDVIGERLDSDRWADYQLLREIARGARARVFLASDGERVRAVKLFPPSLADRARNEVRCAASVDHPNVVAVDGTASVGVYPGVVMEYRAGVRLGDWWRREPSRGAFLRMFGEVLGALDAVHQRGWIHRDVKPDNLLIDRRGTPCLIDFDLALEVGDPAGKRTLAGTVAYLSPEQTRGAPATPASDLYAAGVILYRGLTGEVPFTGSVADVVAAHRTEAARPPSSFDRSLEPFDDLLERLLAKEPERRFHDAITVRTRLARLASPA